MELHSGFSSEVVESLTTPLSSEDPRVNNLAGNQS